MRVDLSNTIAVLDLWIKDAATGEDDAYAKIAWAVLKRRLEETLAQRAAREAREFSAI